MTVTASQLPYPNELGARETGPTYEDLVAHAAMLQDQVNVARKSLHRISNLSVEGFMPTSGGKTGSALSKAFKRSKELAAKGMINMSDVEFAYQQADDE